MDAKELQEELTKYKEIFHAINTITLLANATGSAKEDAKLYHQFKQVISELHTMNETSQELNANFRLFNIMEFMSKQITQTFHAQEVGFFLFSKDHSKLRVLPGTTPFFLTKQSKIYTDLIEAKIHTEKESIF